MFTKIYSVFHKTVCMRPQVRFELTSNASLGC